MSALHDMSALRIDVADLLTHPGGRRRVVLDEEVEGLTNAAATVEGPVSVDVVLQQVPEGIVVRGTLRVRWATDCGVCLRPLTRDLEAGVDELFEAEPIEGETYPLVGHELDLEQLVRDTVVLALPLAPRCEEPCTADRPLADAHSGDRPSADEVDDDTAAGDPRWAALSELEL